MKTIKEYLVVDLRNNKVNGIARSGERVNLVMAGELILIINESEDKSMSVVLNKFGLYGMGVQTKRQHTGKISISGEPKKSGIRSQKEKLHFSISTTGSFTCEAIREEMGEEWLGEHVTVIPDEKFNLKVSGEIVRNPPKKAKSVYSIKNLKIDLSYEKGGVGLLRGMSLSKKSPEFFRAAQSTPVPTLSNLGNCHPDLEVNIRTLTIQPVGFRSSAADMNPTGQSLNAQMAAANTVWNKCCIEFDVLPIHIITDATLKTSSNLTNIRASYTSPTPNVIEVFFVDNNLPGVGGGVASACGSALGNIVMSDNNAGNPQLLAHELGHILGLHHPTASFPGCVQSDADTVMQPSGSPNVPNPTNNTHWNCINVANPALVTSMTLCCLSHDIPDTLLRDFPEDNGTEPNPGFPGRNFYSMSNVWNRKTNTPGGLNPDGTPQHENPARFQSNGVTPHTNYLYARVDAINNLQVRDAEVRFYMKHPGAGSGAANLQLLGTVPVSNALAPGNQQTVSIPWIVPAGTPNHSCTFSVIHTPAEPAQDITGLNWNQTETLIRDDNDWAQRNLTMDQTFPNFGNNDPIRFTFPPIFIEYPKERGLKEAKLIIHPEMFDNKVIQSLELIFPAYDKCIPIRSEKPIELDNSIKPGTRVLVIARAMLNPKAMEFKHQQQVLGITPQIDKLKLVGYAFGVQMNKGSQVISQIMDRGLGGLMDVAEVTGLTSAEHIAGLCREIIRSEITSPEIVVELFKENQELLYALRKDLKSRLKGACNFADADYAFKKFEKAISSGRDVSYLFDCIKDIMGRLELVSWHLYKHI